MFNIFAFYKGLLIYSQKVNFALDFLKSKGIIFFIELFKVKKPKALF